MKRAFPFFLLIIMHSKFSYSQDAGIAQAVAGIGSAAAAVGAIIAEVQNMKESAELKATEYLLEKHPEINSFSLKTLDFNVKKVNDLSNVSVITYKIQEFTPSSKPIIEGKKWVLFGFTSYGWINQSGIDFSRINWYLFDKEEWMKLATAYSKVASEEKNETTINEHLREGNLSKYGVRVKSKLEIPFYKLDGDMYLVTDFSPEMKIIYNEKALGIYLKNTGNLVQLKSGSVTDIHQFLYNK